MNITTTCPHPVLQEGGLTNHAPIIREDLKQIPQSTHRRWSNATHVVRAWLWFNHNRRGTQWSHPVLLQLHVNKCTHIIKWAPRRLQITTQKAPILLHSDKIPQNYTTLGKPVGQMFSIVCQLPNPSKHALLATQCPICEVLNKFGWVLTIWTDWKEDRVSRPGSTETFKKNTQQ